MNISFVDESGISKDSKYFILGILTIGEASSQILKTELQQLKSTNGLSPNIEIKWNLNDFNNLLKKNNLETFDLANHKRLKSEVLNLLEKVKNEDISILWYLSPIMFFRRDSWRSYKYAFSDTFEELSEKHKLRNQSTIALIDEVGNLGIKREDRRKILEDLVLSIEASGNCNNINIIVPNVDSTLSFGHQINDIVLGIINSYLVQLHSDHHSEVSDDIKKALKNLKKFKLKIMIKPSMIKYRPDLQLLNDTTNSSLKKDLD